MDLGRFNKSIAVIAEEHKQLAIDAEITSLIANINEVGSNPASAEVAQKFKDQLNALRKKLHASSLNAPSADVQLALTELALLSYVGLGLYERIQKALDENNLAPQTASQALQTLLNDVQKKYSAILSLNTAFGDLAVEYIELEEGNAEVLTSIPIDEPRTLEDLAKEAKDWHRIYEAIAETFDESRPKITVRTVASGSWLFYLAATPMVIFGAAKCLKGINLILAELIKMRELYGQLVQVKAPQVALDSIEQHNSAKAKTDLDKLASSLIEEFYTGADSGRKNELRNALSLALQKLAKKLASGSTVSLSIRAPRRTKEKMEEGVERLEIDEKTIAKYESAKIEADSYAMLKDLKSHSSQLQTLLPSPSDD